MLKLYSKPRIKRADPEARLQKAVESCPPKWKENVSRVLSRTIIVGECWMWTGAENGIGYGVIHTLQKKNMLTHRLMAAAFIGDIVGKVVCHKCDNPPCCNPEHLFIGTQKENVQDCRSKGRFIHPPIKNWAEEMVTKRHHWQSISREQAIDIKRRLEIGVESRKKIAESHGIHRRIVDSIAVGKRWGHISIL